MNATDDPKVKTKSPEKPSSETSELIKTFTESAKEITKSTTTQSPTKQSQNVPMTTPHASSGSFNANAPPPDVQQRCETKTRGELLHQNKMKPFRSNMPEVRNPSKMQAMHHCLNPPAAGDRPTTRDGTARSWT